MPYTIERRTVNYGVRDRFQYRALVTRELRAGCPERVTTCWQDLRKYAVRDARLVMDGAPTMGARVEAL